MYFFGQTNDIKCLLIILIKCLKGLMGVQRHQLSESLKVTDGGTDLLGLVLELLSHPERSKQIRRN